MRRGNHVTGIDTPVLARQGHGHDTPARLVEVPFFNRGVALARVALKGNEIIAFGDPAGTGKTTTARHVARVLDRPCAVITVPDRPAPLDLLRLIHVNVTGTEHGGTRYDMTNELVRVLRAWAGVLIVDEMQNCGSRGMKELVHLYEATERSFAIAAVGTRVIEAIAEYPQLQSRVLGTVRFEPLHGPELVTAVRELDDRLADTPPRPSHATTRAPAADSCAGGPTPSSGSTSSAPPRVLSATPPSLRSPLS